MRNLKCWLIGFLLSTAPLAAAKDVDYAAMVELAQDVMGFAAHPQGDNVGAPTVGARVTVGDYEFHGEFDLQRGDTTFHIIKVIDKSTGGERYIHLATVADATIFYDLLAAMQARGAKFKLHTVRQYDDDMWIESAVMGKDGRQIGDYKEKLVAAAGDNVFLEFEGKSFRLLDILTYALQQRVFLERSIDQVAAALLDSEFPDAVVGDAELEKRIPPRLKAVSSYGSAYATFASLGLVARPEVPVGPKVRMRRIYSALYWGQLELDLDLANHVDQSGTLIGSTVYINMRAGEAQRKMLAFLLDRLSRVVPISFELPAYKVFKGNGFGWVSPERSSEALEGKDVYVTIGRDGRRLNLEELAATFDLGFWTSVLSRTSTKEQLRRATALKLVEELTRNEWIALRGGQCPLEVGRVEIAKTSMGRHGALPPPK